ncbi:hypothetical protein ACRAWF_46165 [Streptomyces sp. L7]
MSSLMSDLRLAWLLTRGSDRREWWRVLLTVVGAALATGLGQAVAVLLPLKGHHTVSVGGGLLDEPGTRIGVVAALLLLFIPVLGFLGQCARVGAVHPRPPAGRAAARRGHPRPDPADRGAGVRDWPVWRARRWPRPSPYRPCCGCGTASSRRPWAGIAMVAAGVPVLGAAVSALVLRGVVASPLGRIRRLRPAEGPGRLFRVATAVLALSVVYIVTTPFHDVPFEFALTPLTVVGVCLLIGAVAVWLTGASARQLGEGVAARAQRPAVLIAAERLRATIRGRRPVRMPRSCW